MHILKHVKKIAVGVSGGVDSAIGALLLKKQGYNVVGVFMKNWDLTDETGVCSVDEDIKDANFICDRLQIPFEEVNFVKPYWTEVFQEVIDGYKNGITPNPDILCNKYIKFSRFLNYAQNKLGCDMIATGHYARRTFPNVTSGAETKVRLLKALDPNKDQTFFLSQIPQISLQNTLFPLGDYLKTQVKKMASENGLEKIANKKESMGICFIGSRDFSSFIEEYVDSKEGVFIDIDSGKILGRHSGRHHFTVGQRCRLPGLSERLYVVRKTENEEIYVALGHDHPILYGKYVFTSNPYWIHSEPKEFTKGFLLKCQFRFQHRDPLVDCTVFQHSTGDLLIMLDKPVRALTPGQYSVLYKDNECLGSSVISYAGPSEFSLNVDQNALENESVDVIS